jgi:hypothetical protein
MPKRVRDVHAPAISQRACHSSRLANRPPVFQRTTRAPECRNNAVCVLWCRACENLKSHRQWLHAYSNNRLSKIEITIDPARPRPLEKKKNMQAQRRSVSAGSEMSCKGWARLAHARRPLIDDTARGPIARKGSGHVALDFGGAGVVAKDGKSAGPSRDRASATQGLTNSRLLLNYA